MKQHAALILVDLQNDFCPGGNLAVPGGNEIIPLANQLQQYFQRVIATKDWHPRQHMSFASNHPDNKVNDVIKVHGILQVLWPDHCIQETHGSDFHPQFDTSHVDKIIYKGTDVTVDSYSAFFDNEHKRETGLNDYLKSEEINTVYIMGLATDYCVKYSCRDAIKLGLQVYIIEDGCRGVELKPGDIALAMKEIREEGVKVINSKQLILNFT